MDLDALRVHARHDVLDRAILARGVHRLEDDHHGVFRAGPEDALRFAERLAIGVEIFFGLGFILDAGRGVARVVVELDFFPDGNKEVRMVEVLQGRVQRSGERMTGKC